MGRPIRGYVVTDQVGYCLTQDHQWYPHEPKSKGYVHPKTTLLTGNDEWTKRAHQLHPAEYDEATKTVSVSGEPISITAFLAEGVLAGAAVTRDDNRAAEC